MRASPRSRRDDGPRLRLAATLWTLAQHPTAKREWPLARKVAAIRTAGFEGVQAAARPELTPLLRAHSLAHLGAFDAADTAQFRAQIAALKAAGAVLATAQVGEHDTPVARAVELTAALHREAKRQNLLVQVEPHRDTATETPEKFAAICAGHLLATGQRLPVTWDHSHFALVKHLRAEDFVARLLTDPVAVQASRCFHCRPFNGHHCQVPVLNRAGRFTPEFRAWLKFVRALFSLWRAAAKPDDELWVVVEQGAAFDGYNLSVFNPPWRDAVACARALRRVWIELSLDRD